MLSIWPEGKTGEIGIFCIFFRLFWKCGTYRFCHSKLTLLLTCTMFAVGGANRRGRSRSERLEGGRGQSVSCRRRLLSTGQQRTEKKTKKQKQANKAQLDQILLFAGWRSGRLGVKKKRGTLATVQVIFILSAIMQIHFQEQHSGPCYTNKYTFNPITSPFKPFNSFICS